jgi:prepilin-type N-terminal cleavage/methylation domain-containing protein
MKLSIRSEDNRAVESRVFNSRGFTLVEMIIVMAVFISVLLITASSLKTILTKGGVVLRSEESSTEGVIGLEILRHDLQQSGLGLFTDALSTPTYAEAADTPYSAYNDANAVPRAIVAGNNLAVTGVLAGTDYLAIKATTVAGTATSQLWTYVNDTGLPKQWGRDDFTDSADHMIVLEQKYDSSKKTMVRRLVQKSGTNYGVGYSAAGTFKDQNNVDSPEYIPSTAKIYYFYGIDTGVAGTAFTFRAPFNRADFFISQTPAPPASCSPAAGVLYKATMTQSDGTFTNTPIFDCVADMQVVLGWNTSADPEKSNEVQAYTNANGTTVSGNANGLNLPSIIADATEARNRLRLVMVYLLAQDGRRDNEFVNTDSAMVIGDPTLGAVLTKTVDLTTGDFRNYRWKLYRVVVRPKNIF